MILLRPNPTANVWNTLVKFVANQNGIVFLIPKVLPEAAYKIFAGPGLITIGKIVIDNININSKFISFLIHLLITAVVLYV